KKNLSLSHLLHPSLSGSGAASSPLLHNHHTAALASSFTQPPRRLLFYKKKISPSLIFSPDSSLTSTPLPPTQASSCCPHRLGNRTTPTVSSMSVDDGSALMDLGLFSIPNKL
ncbi:hypothetical protein Tsubulata_049934, partial [Turnera subulata]